MPREETGKWKHVLVRRSIDFSFSTPSSLSPALDLWNKFLVDYENYLFSFFIPISREFREAMYALSAKVSGSALCVYQIPCRSICAVTSHRNHFIILSSVEKRVSGPIMLANPRLGTFSQLTMHNFSIYRVFLLFLFHFSLFFSNPTGRELFPTRFSATRKVKKEREFDWKTIKM